MCSHALNLTSAPGNRNHVATAHLMAVRTRYDFLPSLSANTARRHCVQAGANPDQRHPKDGSTPLTLGDCVHFPALVPLPANAFSPPAANSGDLGVLGILLGHDMQVREPALAIGLGSMLSFFLPRMCAHLPISRRRGLGAGSPTTPARPTPSCVSLTVLLRCILPALPTTRRSSAC